MIFILSFILLFGVISCNPEVSEYQFFWEAVTRGDEPLVKKYVDQGIDINLQDKSGYSALYYAVLYNRTNIAKYLIAHGADVNLKDKDGKTPLDIAIFKGNLDLINIINQKQRLKLNNRMMMQAVSSGRLETLKLLLAKNENLNINFQNQNKQTPLIIATILGNEKLVGYLLNLNADTRIKDSAKLTALDYATMLKNKEIIRLLENAEAKTDNGLQTEKNPMTQIPLSRSNVSHNSITQVKEKSMGTRQ